jgi:Penicillin binding protein transpeptidase domain
MATGPFAGRPRRAPGGCGIADGTNRPWSVGDNISLAVGKGDVRVTPLQVAVAYAAIVNGGIVVRPHLGVAIQRADGSVQSGDRSGAGASAANRTGLPRDDPGRAARRGLAAGWHIG